MRAFAFYEAPEVIEPQRVQIILPAFLLAVPIWAGASGILAQYELNNILPFSFKLPISQFGENFIAAIRWMEETDIFVRFILFPHEDAVLNYPLYNGERIGVNAVLEIWSVNSVNAPELADDYTFLSSQFVFPDIEVGTSFGICCQEPSNIITLVQVPPSELPPGAPCNPFCGNLCNVEPPMPVCECPIVVKDTVQDARDYNPTVFISPAILVTQGGGAAGDGYGKAFRWDAFSLSDDDGTIFTSVVRPSSLNSLQPGRWLQTSLG